MPLISPTINWLLTPLSGASHHEIEPWAYWHARLMVLSWSLLLPLGGFAAQFFKVTPKQDWPRILDNKAWWRTHFWVQNIGIGLMTIAAATAALHAVSDAPLATAHHILGWMVAGLGWAQILAGYLRGDKGGPTSPAMRGDHYDMTPRRVVFEYVHKTLGWLALILVLPTTTLGLIIADAPRWMPLVIGSWWMLLIAAFVVLQRQGRCVDTYQAIWGSDLAHPGNRRRPIGWGVIRPLAPGRGFPVLRRQSGTPPRK